MNRTLESSNCSSNSYARKGLQKSVIHRGKTAGTCQKFFCFMQISILYSFFVIFLSPVLSGFGDFTCELLHVAC